MAHGKDLNFALCHVCKAHGKYLATSSFLAGYFILPWVELAHGKGGVSRSEWLLEMNEAEYTTLP